MDAVEHGKTFIVTRRGTPIGELGLPRRRPAVTREQFAAMSENAPMVDAERFRADLDAAFDTESARVFGRVSAAVFATGRTPRRRIADLMIASVAIARRMPLFTTNPKDFAALEALLEVMPVDRPNGA
ncbi:type II toxin-antitoxin system VapC family toxin [Amycolatopsis sp. SID8362]|uniref:type II toxin-antitoxin system VapC family toxin n=1 Tax=Amycolatopsis sp. SID8362 TaxID=2690346 RepID=UPI00136DCC0A|nr:type II toxin-antitoxin system VapC family toxin [Amycolatopsis sp. SID8362]NBH03016.1 hypothetical protein [Amycolatopsis sp. SID8362]NED39717.1 type II toxin-antitoxin system VapC family toxin [Amycolatopsis sp. SID8362]